MIGTRFAKPEQRRKRPMLKARDIMTKEVITVTADTEITQAAKLLL
ncbi:MAG: CBS domain-containing protein, partial [Syntrophaceae bacterium]|nr:CBS domain-containing protein [Syntrophaceae bacterium]